MDLRGTAGVLLLATLVQLCVCDSVKRSPVDLAQFGARGFGKRMAGFRGGSLGKREAFDLSSFGARGFGKRRQTPFSAMGIGKRYWVPGMGKRYGNLGGMGLGKRAYNLGAMGLG